MTTSRKLTRVNNNSLRRKLPPIRNRYFLIADVLLVPLSVMASFWLRLDFSNLKLYVPTMLVFAAVATIIKPIVFFRFGLYRRLWNYAGTRDLISILLAGLVATAAVTLVVLPIPLVLDILPLPRSIPFIDWLVSLVAVGATRFSVRVMADAWHRLPSNGRPNGNGPGEHRVLVVGAGDAGAMMVREMQQNPGLGMRTVGFVDDDRTKLGMHIHGVPVLGAREDIPALAEEHRVAEVIIAMPTAPGQAIRAIKSICDEVKVKYRTVPGMYELIGGTVNVSQIRQVQIEDLLRRDPVVPDPKGTAYLRGTTVMVTGAGGSIGSELCRQAAQQQPRKLVLFDQSESGLYYVDAELRERYPELEVHAVIGDICDLARLERVIGCHRPDTVFHAAAYKHVPLMEANPEEVVLNNVLGTRNLIQAVEQQGVTCLVLISTDKAVNPRSLMGASKRVAELLVQEAAHRSGKCFVAVRFGNVLGSEGSVVPLFKRQIAAGGPLTVTHPEMERYFMTIPEAVHLVIQAVALGDGGELFVLDMGEPVRILDLARDLITLSGLEPGRDVKIEFIGVRPGEKLREELFASNEAYRRTVHEKIFVCGNDANPGNHLREDQVKALLVAARCGERDRICQLLKALVPEYLSEA